MTTTKTTTAAEKTAGDRNLAPPLNLSRERIHFVNNPRSEYRSSLRLRLVGGLVCRR